MSSRLRIRKKSTRIETPDISTAPAQGMFQSRPFVVQTHSAEKSQQQPDLKTALMRAQRYGHHLGRMQPAGLSAPTAIQPKLGMRQSVESYRAKAPQMLQAKLSVGAPGDMYEQKADAVAAQVVDRINGSGERSPAQQPAQESAQSQSIQQRKKKKSSQPLGLNIQPLVQRESAGSVQDAKPHLERSIEQKRGGGQPLSANIRKPIEREFGADFSRVKVHTDAQSNQLNQSIQAKAFTTGEDIFFRQGAYQPESRGGQELLAHELTHVVQQNGRAVQRSQPQAKTIQLLRYQTDNTQIDINRLSFSRILDYLKRPDPDPDTGGVIFEPGDKAALKARADQLYPIEFQRLHNFLGEPEVAGKKTDRNIPAAVNFQNILTEMHDRHAAGNLPGFREWLANTNANLNVENVLDKINELRTAQGIGGAVNVDETPIENTNQTADLTHGNSQTEVKTIRKPIKSYTDFTGQVTAALGKFANVNPGNGQTYNATIYASIDPAFITGRTTNSKGTATEVRIDPANLNKITTKTRIIDRQQMHQATENQVDKLLENLNGQNWGGADRTHQIDIILENATHQHLVRNPASNQWQRR